MPLPTLPAVSSRLWTKSPAQILFKSPLYFISRLQTGTPPPSLRQCSFPAAFTGRSLQQSVASQVERAAVSGYTAPHGFWSYLRILAISEELHFYGGEDFY